MGVFLLGLLVGAAVGTCGVGAGVLVAPALLVLLDVPPGAAVGTALAFGALVKVPALLAYARRGLVAWAVAARMLGWAVPGAVVGAFVLAHLDRADLRGPVLVAVGLVVTAAAATGLVESLRGAAPTPARGRPRWGALALCLPIGLEVGFSSAGAGALGTLLLLRATALAPAVVVGTDLAFGGALAVAGAAVHAGLGTVDPELLSRLGAGGVVGALAGARVATRLPAARLRTLLLWTVAVLGVHTTYRGLLALPAARPQPTAGGAIEGTYR